MLKLKRVVGLIYLIGVIILLLLLPTAAICVVAKLVGAEMSWPAACIPAFIALGVLMPVLISKVLIDYWTES